MSLFGHRLCDDNLLDAIGARALGVEDDPDLVVDQIVCITGREWVHAVPKPGFVAFIGQ